MTASQSKKAVSAKWSEAEDNLLRQHYPSMGKACYKLIPGRTEAATYSKAFKLSIFLGQKELKDSAAQTKDYGEMLAEIAARKPEARRVLTFEETLAAVEAGTLTVSRKVIPRAEPAGPLTGSSLSW